MRGFSIIGLYAIKKDSNAAGAMRAAMCYGAAAVVVQSPHCSFFRASANTTKTERHIPVYHTKNMSEHPLPLGTLRVAVERVVGAQSLLEFSHPERAFYIFGPENGSVHKSIIQAADLVVEIPTNVCMNLAATVNVVLYDRLAKGMGVVVN